MVTYGTPYKRVFGKNDYFTVVMGGNTYALIQYLEAWWQYEIRQVDVLGDEIPEQGTGSFRGGLLARRLFSTDANLLTLQALSSGMVPETTITNALVDRDTPTTKTWTFKARLNHLRHISRIGDFVVDEASGPLTALPTEA